MKEIISIFNSKSYLFKELVLLVVPAIMGGLLYGYVAWSNFLDFDYVNFIHRDHYKCYYVTFTKEMINLSKEIQRGEAHNKNKAKEKVRLDFLMALNSKTTDCSYIK
ncbi:MAG: hypothetical protein AABY22_16040 [Nanoarchaeota archaeon]